MEKRFSRTARLIGESGVEKLKKAHVLIVGVGGVGGYAVEALARTGIGRLTLVDCDKVSESNINRQIIADLSTVGMLKTEAFKDRIALINPDATVDTIDLFVTPENAKDLFSERCDYVIDACDSVDAKLALAKICHDRSIPIISSMGTGNKLDATAFTVADIYDTSVCPLARAMRAKLRKMGVASLKVVYSKEEPTAPKIGSEEEDGLKRCPPGSISFVPAVAGLILAGEVIKEISSKE